MSRIVRIQFGSHLYGTSTPASDVDFKSVYVPRAEDILLQRVKGSVSTKRPKGDGEKNYAGEIDEESYSLQRYLGLLAEGQTVATDILFAPEWSMAEPPDRLWREIIANKDRLVTKRSSSFVGYCRQQANKYGIKGSRVAAARAALEMLEIGVARNGGSNKLSTMYADIQERCAETKHMEVVQLPQASGQVLLGWDVCGRKLPYTTSIKYSRDIIAKLVEDYGARSLQAESQQGVDWKALSHAVRVATQAIELMDTGRVTFPLPNALHILDIKLGRLPYQAVAEDIERLLVEVEAAAEASTLRAEPDRGWIDEFVSAAYREAVLQ